MGLRAHIEKQEQVIDENNRQLENIMRMENKIRLEIDNKKKGVSSGSNDDDQKLPDGVKTATRTVTRVNDDGDEYEETEEYYVDADGKEVLSPIGTNMSPSNGNGDNAFSPTTPSQLSRQTSAAMQRVLSGLNDTEKEFMKGLGEEFLEQMAEDGLMSGNNGTFGDQNGNGNNGGGKRARTVTMEENQEAL